MNDKAIDTAHNPAAPQDERDDAMRMAQQEHMPSSVPDMTAMVKYVQEKYEEEMMNKALSKPNVIPFPSRAVERGEDGMQSLWIDDQRIQMMGEWYERPSNFSFDMMRQMVAKTPVLNAVISTRIRQIKRFCRVPDGGKGPGFEIRLRDPNAKIGANEKKSIQALQSFFTNCGWETDPRQRQRLKRDNFSNFMSKVVRDSLTMDSSPIETEFKRDRSKGIDGLYAVDGATIRLCNESGYQGDDELFALQVVEGRIRTAYTYDDLIYVPRNPRTDVIAGGYGMSEVESLVAVVTGFLNAMTYNLKFFDSNAIPKGLLHLSGEYSQEDMAAFRRYWNAMVKGIDNAWSLPVMVSKNQESKVAFEPFGVDTTDAMFTKWMIFLTSLICAIYGIAPDEINFESFSNGASSLSGNDTEEKLINSKDKGLRPLLAHFEDVFSDYIVASFDDKYVFRWTGLDEKTQDQIWDEEKTLLTFNEARKSRNWDEVKEDWANAPLNQTMLQAWMAEKGQQQEAQHPGAQDNQPDDNDKPDEDPNTKKFNKLLADGAKRQGDASDENGEEMAKAFGMPAFRIEL